jgi:hypothetical protein
VGPQDTGALFLYFFKNHLTGRLSIIKLHLEVRETMKTALAGYAARHGLRVSYRPEIGRVAVLRRKGRYVLEVTVYSTTSAPYFEGTGMEPVGYEYPAGVRPLEAEEMVKWLDTH